MSGTAAPSDRRLQRGVRSRRTITRHGVDVASVRGLSGLSFGELATDLGLSKSGVQILFGTKENLQLAVAETAREVFDDAVVRPAADAPRGVARLRALVERWITYAEGPLFPGGCFWAANIDGRKGPVHDLLQRHQQGWRSLIAAHLRDASDAGEIADLDPDLAAFQIDAVLVAANSALRSGDSAAVDRVRRIVDGVLAERSS